MISNERQAPCGDALQMTREGAQPNQEEIIKWELIQIERKTFILTLRENSRGRFLRITEKVNDRYETIIIPSTGLGEFAALLAEMVEATEKLPAVGTQHSSRSRCLPSM